MNDFARNNDIHITVIAHSQPFDPQLSADIDFLTVMIEDETTSAAMKQALEHLRDCLIESASP